MACAMREQGFSVFMCGDGLEARRLLDLGVPADAIPFFLIPGARLGLLCDHIQQSIC